MKILLLFPMDERYSAISMGIYKNLTEEAKKKTFVMPMFNDWQLITKKMVVGSDVPRSWDVATFGTLLKAKELYRINNEKKEDYLLIGNIDAQYEFDAVFNFQDPEADEPYEDKYLDLLRQKWTDIPELSDLLRLHTANESKMTLHNYAATGAFLSAYLETDPNLEAIKAKYTSILHFKNEEA